MHNSAGVGLSLTSRRLQTGNNQCASAEPPYRSTAGLQLYCFTYVAARGITGASGHKGATGATGVWLKPNAAPSNDTSTRPDCIGPPG